jgi:coniferyl-aldehyde dehydrogenase
MTLAPVDTDSSARRSHTEHAEHAGSDLRATLDTQRAAYAREPYPPLEVRRDRIQRLIGALTDQRNEIVRAVSADFGHRSKHESLVSEVFLPVSAGRYVLRNLKGWMRTEGRPTTFVFKPARSEVVPQPLGVVGIISPWNYPIQLALVPVIYALAAGNRVMLKPSELTPRTSEKMAEILGSLYPNDLVSVVQGDASVGAAFAELPFDHLLYTGSTRVGRLVMQAAAKNLVPVTLELGGKSPAIVHPEFPVERAAESLASAKLFNAGQTCVAPDYVLVRKDKADALCEAIASQAARMYPRLADNPDYTSVINERHKARLASYLDDARAKGASLVEINPANESFAGAASKMAPVLVRRPTEDMLLMQEEIFGPILPIVEVDSIDAALRYVNDHPRPLALYYFDTDGERIDRVVRTTHSGGVTINECMLHVAEEHLPFGGVGPSGMGAYHGREGFDAFSHRKAVFRQPRVNGRWLLLPPFGSRLERLLDWLI